MKKKQKKKMIMKEEYSDKTILILTHSPCSSKDTFTSLVQFS